MFADDIVIYSEIREERYGEKRNVEARHNTVVLRLSQ